MTPTEIQLAIAEECGWTDDFAEYKGKRKGSLLLPYQFINKNTGQKLMDLPDFCSSLDAIQQAAMDRFKKKEERDHFMSELIFAKHDVYSWELTPLDWCEAFLRTVGKWKE
jgi:hypothetical protein